MIPLFRGRSGVQYSVRHSPYFANLKDMLEIDTFRVMNYHRDSSRAVNNSDFIIKLIKLVNANVNLSMFDYLSVVEARYKYAEKTMGIISHMSFGRIVEILDGDAVVLSIDRDEDVLSYKDNWETLAPIRPFSTDTVDVSLPHPTRMNTGFTGYTIDTRALLMMWWWYCKGKSAPQIAYFVYRYVYNNMIPYYLDHAIVNLFLGTEPKEFKNTNPIHVIDQTRKIQRYLKPLIKKTKGKKLFYEELMLNLRLVKSKDMFELFAIPMSVFTRQSRHGIFYLYKNVTLSIMLFLGDRGIRRNLRVMTDLFLFTQRMLNRKDITAIDYGLYEEDITATLELIYEISKNRRL